jgi:hypothetical protein
MVRGKQAKRQGQKMKKKEDKIQEAVVGIQSKKYKNAREASEDLGIPDQAATIHRRLKGTSKSRIESQVQFQLLSPVKEAALVQWIKFYGFAGLPLSKKVLYAKVKELCGRVPGNHWFDHFLRRHPDCTPGRHSGLDPKRTAAFNPATVKAHFDLLQTEFDNGGRPIPARNIYNMDEVGIQRGGGRKNSRELFLFSSTDKARYKLKSDDLELTTILEVCSLSGWKLDYPPWFRLRW